MVEIHLYRGPGGGLCVACFPSPRSVRNIEGGKTISGDSSYTSGYFILRFRVLKLPWVRRLIVVSFRSERRGED